MEYSSCERFGSTVFLVLLSSACSSTGPSSGWEGTVDTLANGAVRVTNPAGGIWTEDPPWRLVPELSLGAVEGDPREVFAAVTGLEVDDQGRIYVLDRQTNELRIFSAEGEHLRSAGRAGSGPGEYMNANGLEWLAQDSLLVVDQRGNRYTVLDRNGEYVRSVPRHLGFYGWAFRGGVSKGRVFEQTSLRVGEDYHPAVLSTLLQDNPNQHTGSVVGDTVMLPRSEAPPYEIFSIQTERGGMSMGVPFAPSAVYHLDDAGYLWHGHGSEFRISRSTLVGDTVLEVLIHAEQVPVTEAELAEWEAGPGPQQFRDLGGNLDMGRIPRLKPFFDGLYRDPEGYLWASVPSGPSEAAFAVIDPDGRFLGRLEIQGLERVEWIDPVVRNGRLYMATRDELDVEHVHVFRIER